MKRENLTPKKACNYLCQVLKHYTITVYGRFHRINTKSLYNKSSIRYANHSLREIHPRAEAWRRQIRKESSTLLKFSYDITLSGQWQYTKDHEDWSITKCIHKIIQEYTYHEIIEIIIKYIPRLTYHRYKKRWFSHNVVLSTND